MSIGEVEGIVQMSKSISADAWNSLTDCMNYGSAMQMAAVNVLKILYKRVQNKECINLNLKKSSSDYSKIIDINSFDAIILQFFNKEILDKVKE